MLSGWWGMGRMSDGEKSVTVPKPPLPQWRGRGLPDGVHDRRGSNSWTDLDGTKCFKPDLAASKPLVIHYRNG